MLKPEDVALCFSSDAGTSAGWMGFLVSVGQQCSSSFSPKNEFSKVLRHEPVSDESCKNI